MHLGHTRWAAVGDALGRVLSAAGADVSREFYINDRGNQMDLFGASLEAAALGKSIPEDGYQGNYIHDLAQEVVGANVGIKDLPEPVRLVEFRERGYQLQLSQQKKYSTLLEHTLILGFQSARSMTQDPLNTESMFCVNKAMSLNTIMQRGFALLILVMIKIACLQKAMALLPTSHQILPIT